MSKIISADVRLALGRSWPLRVPALLRSQDLFPSESSSETSVLGRLRGRCAFDPACLGGSRGPREGGSEMGKGGRKRSRSACLGVPQQPLRRRDWRIPPQASVWKSLQGRRAPRLASVREPGARPPASPPSLRSSGSRRRPGVLSRWWP